MAKHQTKTLAQTLTSGAVIAAVTYGRVSSEVQLHGEGLRRQREKIEAWIARHPEMHIRVDAALEDRARSAWKGDHATKDDAALASILKQVQSGELLPPLLLIMESLDRFSRENTWVAAERLFGVVGRGVFVATVRDDKIYEIGSSLGDMIMSVVLLAAAHDSSEATSQRVSATKRVHVLDAIAQSSNGGKSCVIHRNVPAWCEVSEPISKTNRASRRVVLIEQHGETVLRIYRLGLTHGSEWVTRWLIEHQDEYPPFGRTGKWSLRAVKKILRSRATIGVLESKHGTIADAYPRIPGLTDELWLQVKHAQNQRKNAGPQPWKADRVNLLRGIARCYCGSIMRLGFPKGRDGFGYYRCHRHVVLRTCDNSSSYRADVIENALFGSSMKWLEAKPAKTGINLNALEADYAKVFARQKRLEAKLQELDDDDMANSVFSQLRELRGKVTDAATRLSAARQQAAVAQAPIVIGELTDRAELATALRQALIRVRFERDNRVEMESRSMIMSLIARGGSREVRMTLKPKRSRL